MVQSIRAFASHAEGLLFKSQPRQTRIAKTGSESSTAKRSVTNVGVDNYKRMSRVTEGVAP